MVGAGRGLSDDRTLALLEPPCTECCAQAAEVDARIGEEEGT